MQDPHFGHRDPFTGGPLRDSGEWTDWDYAITGAFQLVNDLTDKHGLLVHETDSERVMVSAKKQTDRFQAAIDRATKGGKKGYNPSPGEYFVPVMELRYGDWPTVEEYFQREAERAEADAVQ